jgi:hypothetical protein
MATKIISLLFCGGAYPIVMKVVMFNGSRHETMITSCFMKCDDIIMGAFSVNGNGSKPCVA